MTWHPDMPDEYKNQIVTGDARILAERIPDESVDLIFTDPVYDQIDDYRWLAETAARVLKPDRALLAWQATPLLAKTLPEMDQYLDWAWMLYWQRHGYMAPGKAGICVITTCLWWEKGHSKTRVKMADWYATANGGVNAYTHRWGKPLDLVLKWINAFTVEDDVIYDPFSGSSVIAAACKILGRNYVAFEIDPTIAYLARERVANTQPPLFVPEPEQMELAL